MNWTELRCTQAQELHHGDPLVPRQQRFGQYTRSLMKGLGVPVHNTYGLRPALVKGTNEIAPLTPFHDLDSLGLLRNVPTLNFHPHLPHYELTGGATSVQVLARQPIDLERPHPFTEAGAREFNCLLWKENPPQVMQLQDRQGVRLRGDRFLYGFGVFVKDVLAARDYFRQDREAVTSRRLGKDRTITSLLHLLLEVPPPWGSPWRPASTSPASWIRSTLSWPFLDVFPQ
jgi:hypothetical protein